MATKVNWTTQRRVIYDLVNQATDHPTANDIMDRLRQAGHQFAYGTVYNSLRYLVDMDLIRELKLGNAVSRYDGRTEEHLHMLCEVCGQVFEAAVELPTTWIETVMNETHFRVTTPEIILHGICEDCRSKSQSLAE